MQATGNLAVFSSIFLRLIFSFIQRREGWYYSPFTMLIYKKKKQEAFAPNKIFTYYTIFKSIL